MQRTATFLIVSLLMSLAAARAADDQAARLHNIFGSHMVIQRDKPIVIWGWAPAGQKVAVQFGKLSGEATAAAEGGRWEVKFPAQEANATPQKLTVKAGGKTIELTDILIGDVWVMNGQSNMAFALGRTFRADMEIAAAHLPLLRRVGIGPNESDTLQVDIPAEGIQPWTVCTPQTAGKISSIGYSFASRLQRALRIPIGIIDNARGGASLESLVPRHKFADDPLAAAYLKSVEKRQAEFDWDAALKPLLDKWEKTVADQRAKGVAADQLPPKPTRRSLRSWNVPGRSPNDAASCYNGMFGAFKGLGIKGVLFHQGYNNAMGRSSRPKRYRVLMPLMIQGWREDFQDEKLPVGVIGLCAGGITQDRENFEEWTTTGPAAYIREAQRLGIADLPHTAFIPAYDQKLAGLHTRKKLFLATRAARWALKDVYGLRVAWDRVKLLSAEREGNKMLLTFDRPVAPDDGGPVEGFAIADKSGKFYLARAESHITLHQGLWGNKYDRTKLYVWSLLVKEPVAVRYAWARSPMGNLKIHGKPWQPVPSFRTDSWDWPEPEGFGTSHDRAARNKWFADAKASRIYRQQQEAKMAPELLKQREEYFKVLAEKAAEAGRLKRERRLKARAEAAAKAAAKKTEKK